MITIKACIFDLDGVIVDTAKYHYIAWKKLADKLHIPFGEKENESLKGISRMTSLNKVLALGRHNFTEAEKIDLAEEKNKTYLGYVAHMAEDDVLPGVREFLLHLKKSGIGIALGSSSKNAQLILDKIQLASLFDVVVDGNMISEAKPDPQVFLKAASSLQVSPDEAIVFEDAVAGVEAALRGGFYCVGIGDEKQLQEAHLVIRGFKDFSLEKFEQMLNRKN